jgi:hypothetical protein
MIKLRGENKFWKYFKSNNVMYILLFTYYTHPITLANDGTSTMVRGSMNNKIINIKQNYKDKQW